MLTLEQFGIVVAIIVGLTAVTYYLLSIYKMMRNPPPEFLLQRFKETVDTPVKSNWSIRILHPNKPIQKCMVLYDETQLPWWDKTTPSYEKTIEASGGGNVRIPVDIEKEDAEIKVMDGKRRLKKVKFREIAET